MFGNKVGRKGENVGTQMGFPVCEFCERCRATGNEPITETRENKGDLKLREPGYGGKQRMSKKEGERSMIAHTARRLHRKEKRCGRT